MEINQIKTKNKQHKSLWIKQKDNASIIELYLCDSNGKTISTLNGTCTITIFDTRDRVVREKTTGNISSGLLSFKITNHLKPHTHTLEVTINGVKYPSDGKFYIEVSLSHDTADLNIIESITKEEAISRISSDVVAMYESDPSLFQYRSLYEIAQSSGFSGTESEFIDSMRGQDASAEEVAIVLKPDLLRNNPQIDYVEKLTPLVHYDEIQVAKTTATTVTITNFNKVTGRHVTNVLSKNANDDYWILSDSYIGATTFSEFPKEYKNYEKVSGTIDTTYATHWASLGAKIKVEVSGSEIYFRRFGDNRGGVWRFIIDGDTANPIDVSVYKATSGTDVFKIKGGLEDKLHLVEAEFIGDDPANVPAGGAGTSRGWLSYHATTDVNKTFESRFLNLNLTKDKTLNAALSNKDFAILCRKSGTSDEFHFVPEHNAKGSAFKINEPQFILDGKLLDLNAMQIGIKQIGKQFSLIQSVYGRHPISGENLLRIDSTHDFKIDSTVHLMGKVAALVDVEIKDAYFLMLPVMNDVARRLKSSRFNKYDTLLNDGSRINLTDEKDDTSSYVYTSDVNINLFSALTIKDTIRSLRTGMANKFPEGQTTWNEQRANSTMQKLYNSIYRYGTLLAGQELYYDGIYISGETPNIHNMI